MPMAMNYLFIMASISIVQLFIMPRKFNKLRLLLVTNVPTLLFILYQIIELVLTNSGSLFTFGWFIFAFQVQSIVYYLKFDIKAPVWMWIVRIIILLLYPIPAFMTGFTPGLSGVWLVAFYAILILLVGTQLFLIVINDKRKKQDNV